MTRDEKNEHGNNDILLIPIVFAALYLLMNTKKIETAIEIEPIESWQVVENFNNGLNNIGNFPIVESYGNMNIPKIMVGSRYGINNYAWSFDRWILDNSELIDIQSSIIGDMYYPTIFDNGTKMMIGTMNGGIIGYNYQNAKWNIDNSITSGLTNYGRYAHPTVFEHNNVFRMIIYSLNSIPYGFTFANEMWNVDNLLTQGLPSGIEYFGNMLNIRPKIFKTGDEIKLALSAAGGGNIIPMDIYTLNETENIWTLTDSIPDLATNYQHSFTKLEYNNLEYYILGKDDGSSMTMMKK